MDQGRGAKANTCQWTIPVPQCHVLRGWDTGMAQGLTHCIHEAFWWCCKEQGMLRSFSWCTWRAVLPVTVQQPRCCQTNAAGKNLQTLCASGGSRDRALGSSGQEMRKGRGALGKLWADIKSCCHSVCFKAIGVHLVFNWNEKSNVIFACHCFVTLAI